MVNFAVLSLLLILTNASTFLYRFEGRILFRASTEAILPESKVNDCVQS